MEPFVIALDQGTTSSRAILFRRSGEIAARAQHPFRQIYPCLLYTSDVYKRQGLLSPDGSFKLSILKSSDGDPSCCQRFFYAYDRPLAGEGRFIHTYRGDGSPLPSFEGEPVRVSLKAPDPETLAGEIWEALNDDNKVSLFVRYIDRADGSHRDAIRNKNQ